MFIIRDNCHIDDESMVYCFLVLVYMITWDGRNEYAMIASPTLLAFVHRRRHAMIGMQTPKVETQEY